MVLDCDVALVPKYGDPVIVQAEYNWKFVCLTRNLDAICMRPHCHQTFEAWSV